MLSQMPLIAPTVRSKTAKNLSQLSRPCALTWHDRKLLIQATRQEESWMVEVLQDSDRVVECLTRSLVESVELDAGLSPEMLVWWAEACGKAKKTCYMKIQHSSNTLSQPKPLIQIVYKSIHRITAIILAVAMLPLLPLVLTVLGTSVLDTQKQWAIGERGRLVHLWVWQESLDYSIWLQPIRDLSLKLINVIQGEILLNAPMPNVLGKAIVH
jgi:hypothetical protein